MASLAAPFLSRPMVATSCCNVCSSCRVLTTRQSSRRWDHHPMESLFVGENRSPDHAVQRTGIALRSQYTRGHRPASELGSAMNPGGWQVCEEKEEKGKRE